LQAFPNSAAISSFWSNVMEKEAGGQHLKDHLLGDPLLNAFYESEAEQLSAIPHPVRNGLMGFLPEEYLTIWRKYNITRTSRQFRTSAASRRTLWSKILPLVIFCHAPVFFGHLGFESRLSCRLILD